MVEHNAGIVSEQIACSLRMKSGCSTLSLFRYGKVEVVEYLVQRASCRTDCKDDNGKTPLHHACQ